MKSRWYLMTALPFLVLFLGACSTGITAPENLEGPSDFLANDIQNNNGTSDEGSSSITEEEAKENETAANHSAEVCEDPFEGAIPSFWTDEWDTNFCLHNVPYDEIFSGGPPRDGIPPIDSPRFETVDSADTWIEDVEPVIILEVNDAARAYPLQILIWHEIVNDEIDRQPVVVTFCPLCNTALVFARPVIDGKLLTFGTSSDLVMWDRQTESWWQQFNGEAIVGDLTGTKLEFLPSAIISWADFKSKHPDGQVLSIETGFPRSYGRNPYSGYDNINSYPFAYTGDLDDRLPPMARVLGILLEDGEGSAYSFDLLKENQVLNEIMGDTPVAIFWKAGTASAVDSSTISDGKDVGTTGVFLSTVGDQVLTFTAKDNGTFEDQETGSVWDILGEAITGPLAGTRLVSLPHHNTFWFAWAAFVADGTLTK
jgi:hypothetical protein